MLTVTDKDGGVSTRNRNNDLTAPAYVVIYDPSAGFVTGGGWVSSPAGASVEFPTAVGKALFGFVSKYQKGEDYHSRAHRPDSVPVPRRCDSTSTAPRMIGWSSLVPGPSSRATGTINGSGDYGFILTAIDGAVAGGGGI